eukprot:Pgem_evm1s565
MVAEKRRSMALNKSVDDHIDNTFKRIKYDDYISTQQVSEMLSLQKTLAKFELLISQNV